MRALVDTQVWLWMLAHPERIGPKATRLLGSEAELLLSAATAWEIAIKHRLGTLELPETPERYVPERMRLTGMTPLPVEHSHALGVATLADIIVIPSTGCWYPRPWSKACRWSPPTPGWAATEWMWSPPTSDVVPPMTGDASCGRRAAGG